MLDTRSRKVDYEMLVGVANAIASLVDQNKLKEDYILPRLNDLRLTSRITRTLTSSNSETSADQKRRKENEK